MTHKAPQCLECKNYNSLDSENLTCIAYPNGIPDNISTGEHDHKEPFEGDNGVQFEPIEEN